MSKDDARRTGETIRQLFFDARHEAPRTRRPSQATHFTQDEREGLADGLGGVSNIDMLEIQIDKCTPLCRFCPWARWQFRDDSYPVRRGTAMKLDDFSALVWVHGATTALQSAAQVLSRQSAVSQHRSPYGGTPGSTDLQHLAEEILGLSKMNWNTFDLYTKLPATVHSSNEIARIGSLLQRFG